MASEQPTVKRSSIVPGEILFGQGDIELNTSAHQAGAVLEIDIVNTGDRPVQVGSHVHLPQANRALSFDRAAARGMRLNIASGTAVRFEPGQQRSVELVAFGGDRIVHGFRGLVGGPL